MAPSNVQGIDFFKGCLLFLSTVSQAMLILITLSETAPWLPKFANGG